MATILIQPDSLSLSSNLKKFEIAASAQVRFKLALGGSYIIDETYSPNAAGRVVIDIKDVVKEHLSLALPSSDIFQQNGLAKSFSAEIDSLPAFTFTVLRAGVENLSDTPTNFLSANWLTWQPQTKQAGYYQPEWLTYYAPVAAVIKVKFYLKDGNTAIITLHSPATGTCYTYNMQFSYIMSLQAGEKYGYYDVWAENVAGERLTYIQRYVYREQEDADEFFVFENSLGGLDTAVMNGESIFSPEMEHSEGLYDDIAQQLDGTVTRLFEKNTGWKSKPEADWLFDFFNSQSRFKVADGTLRRITIKESSVSDSSQEDLKSFTFVYRLAQDLGLLNVPRTMDPPPANLEILTPEGLFFLAPRLNEFPSAELDPTLIFPVQSPYSEVWRKISWGAMYDQLYGQILSSPVGQLAHAHENYSVISLLTDVGGKLYYNGFEIGGSDGGSTGTNDHDKLMNRNKVGQHPMSAISGLDAALLSKAYISGSISQDFAARRFRSHTLLLPTETPDLLEGEYALTVLSAGFSGETPGGGSGIGFMRDLQDVAFDTNLTDDHAPVYVTAVSKFQNKRVSLYGHTHTEYALKAGDLNQDFSAKRLKSRTLLIPTSDTLDLQTGEYALTILASGFSGETPSGGAAINVLSDVGDVQLTDLADYQVLMRYSNNWVNRTLLKSHIADFPTTWAWTALSGIPTTFTPAAHTHTKSQISDFPTNLLTSASLTPGYLPYFDGSIMQNSLIRRINDSITEFRGPIGASLRITTDNSYYADFQQNGGGGVFEYGTYVDFNIINRVSGSTFPFANINFITGNNDGHSIAMTIGGGSQKGFVGVGYTYNPDNYKFAVNGSGYYNSHLTANGRFKSNTLLIPSVTPELQEGEYALTVLSSGFSGENPPAGAINVLSDVGDVSLLDLVDYQVLMRVSGSWVNRTLLKAHIADFAHNHDALYMPITPADDSISASKILQSSTRRFVTDSEKSAWSAKWDYNENTIKAVKVNSATDSDKLLNHTLYDLTYQTLYNPSNGLLITTDIPASSEAMFSIEITGNGYSGENLNATFSGYWSNSAATFYTLKGFSAGGVTSISSFVSDGFLCFHVQPTASFQTYRVWVSCESRKNRVILLYNAAKPAGRTSEQNTTLNIMRHSGNFRAGLEYQTPIAAGTYAPFTHYHDYLSIYGGTVAGAINVTDSTSATSSTTGALRVAGGISTQNNLHVGNELVAAKMRIPKWNSFSPPTGLQSGQYYLYIIE